MHMDLVVQQQFKSYLETVNFMASLNETVSLLP
jgi:hypothetical protein